MKHRSVSFVPLELTFDERRVVHSAVETYICISTFSASALNKLCRLLCSNDDEFILMMNQRSANMFA